MKSLVICGQASNLTGYNATHICTAQTTTSKVGRDGLGLLTQDRLDVMLLPDGTSFMRAKQQPAGLRNIAPCRGPAVALEALKAWK